MFSYSAFTYFAQNHPVIQELYRRHQRDLWFAGVVVTVAPVTIVEKQRNAHLAARLTSEVLGADGVIATKIGGGAVDTDLMMIYERCEEMGLKAALIIMERYPTPASPLFPTMSMLSSHPDSPGMRLPCHPWNESSAVIRCFWIIPTPTIPTPGSLPFQQTKSSGSGSGTLSVPLAK
jgi:hypothetical protein